MLNAGFLIGEALEDGYQVHSISSRLEDIVRSSRGNIKPIIYHSEKEGDIIILIECKWSGADLCQDHASQLYRYFSTTEARFGILTNGIDYEFYSDIDEPNKMDSKPFFTFNILDFQSHQIVELKKFTKSAFSLDDILTTASTLKYTGAIKKILEVELSEPSESFVRFFASQIFEGRLTKAVIEQFTSIVKEARKQFINEQINERLKSALSANDNGSGTEDDEWNAGDMENETKAKRGIETTEEEIEGYYTVKATLREILDVSRVTMRDTKSYCGILLDDNSRKPICRLHFNTSRKYLGLMSAKTETRVAIDSIDDIYQYSEQIKSAVLEYEQQGENMEREGTATDEQSEAPSD